MKDYIENKILENGKIPPRLIKFEGKFLKLEHPEFYENLIKKTNFLPNSYTLVERLFHVYNDLNEIYSCKVCKKPIRIKLFSDPKIYCSRECAKKDVSYIHDKIKNTNLEKYGSVSPFGNKEIRSKSVITNLEKYGTEHPTKSLEIKEKTRLTYLNKSRNAKKESSLSIPEKEIAYKNLESDIKNVEVIVDDNLIMIKTEIHEFLKELKLEEDIILNDRSTINPLELDFLIGNVAIEVNGMYWHRDRDDKNKNRHFYKWRLCKDKNIRLIQFCENEWYLKSDKIKSIIKNALGIYSKLIYGRQTTIKEISVAEYRDFMNENHIQGYVQASIKLGLFFEDELVSVASFGKNRFDKNSSLELIRFANKRDYRVIYALSKFMKYVERNYEYESVTSYCDLRYFNGDGYLKSGFNFVSISKPSYYYFKNSYELYNRISFQKHKLKDKLEIFDENLSESENMKLNKYDKIYDCGNIKLSYSFN